MSSLLQFRGQIKNGKVGLLFYLQIQLPTIPIHCNNCLTPLVADEWDCLDCKLPFCGKRTEQGWQNRSEVLGDNAWEGYQWTSQYGIKSAGATITIPYPIDAEPIQLTHPDGSISIQPQLYRCWRKPVGMFGCWVVFRYNGTENVPDLSCPISTLQLPRDAKPLSVEEQQQYWFKDNQ